jgi:hypothetical protein
MSFFIPDGSQNLIQVAGDISFVARDGTNVLDYVMLSEDSGLESKFPVNSFRRTSHGFVESNIVQTSPIFGFKDTDGTWDYDVSEAELLAKYPTALPGEIKEGQARLNMKLIMGGAPFKLAYTDFGMFVGVNDISVGGSRETRPAKYIPFVAAFEQYRVSMLPPTFSATFVGGAVGHVTGTDGVSSSALMGSAQLTLDTAGIKGNGNYENLRISFDNYYTIDFNDAGRALVSGNNNIGYEFNISGGCKAGCYGDISQINYYGPSVSGQPMEASGYFYFTDTGASVGSVKIEGVFGARKK